jgi:serine/threonine-protein kinase
VRSLLGTGQTIAGYQVDEVLASGGMGVVYRATQLSLGRTVALKVLAPHLSADEVFRERFRREAALQARLEHPHIVTVYEAGECDEGLYLALRFIDGMSLKKMVEPGPLDPGRALRLMAQVASALDTAHEAGLVHRDVKPQNVLIDLRDQAYLADFGLTKSAGHRGLTETGTYIGSLEYVPPEQWRGAELTPASDRYAFAGVLYEALTGEVPYPRDTEAALLYAHVADAPPRPTERRPELPPALDEVIARGMAKDPEARYASATELVRAAELAMRQGAPAPGPALEAAAPAPEGPTVLEPLPVTNGHIERRAGDTIVDPGLLRRAPVIELEPERKLPGPYVLAAIALVIAGLAAVGFLLGHSRTRAVKPPFSLAIARQLALSFPTPEWQQGPGRAPKGLDLADPVSLRGIGPAARASLVAGIVPDVAPQTLLPPSLARANKSAQPQLARVGPYVGVRYRHLRFGGHKVMLYAVPVGKGAALIACHSLTVEGRDRCNSVADSLLLQGIVPGGVGPDPRYARFLRALVSKVDAVRLAERHALGSGRTPGERAGHADLIASTLATATSQLEAVQPGIREREIQSRLDRALGHARDGYVTLAASLRAGDRPGFIRGRRAIVRAEAATDAALRSFAALGYPVPAAPHRAKAHHRAKQAKRKHRRQG